MARDQVGGHGSRDAATPLIDTRDHANDLGRPSQGVRHPGAGGFAIDPRQEIDTGRRSNGVPELLPGRSLAVLVSAVCPADGLKRLQVGGIGRGCKTTHCHVRCGDWLEPIRAAGHERVALGERQPGRLQPGANLWVERFVVLDLELCAPLPENRAQTRDGPCRLASIHRALDDRHPGAGPIRGGNHGSERSERHQVGSGRVLFQCGQLPGLKAHRILVQRSASLRRLADPRRLGTRCRIR